QPIINRYLAPRETLSLHDALPISGVAAPGHLPALAQLHGQPLPVHPGAGRAGHLHQGELITLEQVELLAVERDRAGDEVALEPWRGVVHRVYVHDLYGALVYQLRHL